MRRPVVIQKDYEQIGTIKNLTSVFESIASMHIAQIKDKVVASTNFFNELWQVYAMLRAGKAEELTGRAAPRTDRTALVAVTSEGGLIGDIDERIVDAMLAYSGRDRADIYVIGSHGATLLAQRGVKPTKVFASPDVERGGSVTEFTNLIGSYAQATIYYQTYISLMRQDIARIDLFAAVQALGKESVNNGEYISSQNYIFEPSAKEIIAYLESVMLEIAAGQVLLESKLAQYASRFNAMYAAKTKATDMQSDLGLMLSRSKRSAGDERTKEILSAMKLAERRD